MIAGGFCPQCGNQRVGALRYCRSCGFDFDQVAGPAAAQQPLGTMNVDRRAQAQLYRSQVGWSCLGRVMVIGGIVVGFVLGAFIAEGPLASSGTVMQLVIGFFVGPAIGAALGWYLWTELWGRR